MEYEYLYLDPNEPLEARVNDLVSRMTIDEKISLIPTREAAVKRLGIKEYSVGGEAAHGLVSRIGKSTVFPQPIGLASTWDSDLMEHIGTAIGEEARAYYKKNDEKGGLTLWAPTIDMERDPRWGRTEESYGEDPHLTGKQSAALIRGMQGYDPFYLQMTSAPKHFYANNNEEGRIWCSSSIDPRNKHEYYLKAFKPAFVEGHAYSLMTAYNEINGTPCILNPEVQSIVKDEWGMKGFVVCDGGDMSQTVEYHKYYKTHAETVAGALKNGVDCLTDDAALVIKSLKEALDLRLLTDKDIDKAITNILNVRFKLGQFDPKELNPYSKITESAICSPEHSAIALKAAREAIVLLKNESNILPLNRDTVKSVAVIGPLGDVVLKDWYCGTHPYKITPLQGIKSKMANKSVTFTEGYDDINILSSSNNKYLSVSDHENNNLIANKTQVNLEETFACTDWGWGSYTLRSKSNNKYVTTGDKALTVTSDEVFGWFVKELYDFVPDAKDSNEYVIKTWNGKNVSASKGGDMPLEVNESNIVTSAEKFIKTVTNSGIADAVAAAKAAEVAIVVVGNNPVINGKEEIDRKDIILPPAQEELIKAVYKANPNTIVVIVGSYPMAINWENDNIPAILYSAPGGQELGNAIADVLFGDYNPAGRLSMTWYKSIEQLNDITDYDIINGKRTYMYFDGRPLYPFGYGLTYSTFEYSNLKLDSKEIYLDGQVIISFDITNTGLRESDEVVQLYVSSTTSRVKRAIKELKGFKRINLVPNQTQNISFTLKSSELAFWDVTRDIFCVESGSYIVMVGKSSTDIKLRENIKVIGEIVPHRNLNVTTRSENYDNYSDVFLGECKEGGTCVSVKTINIPKIAISNKVINSFIMFDDVEFGCDVKGFEARISNDSTSEGTIEIRIDGITGELIGTCPIPITGRSQSWVTTTCPINKVTGIHKVFLKFNGKINLSTFSFIK